jgi:prevent-host-death family protein
MQINHANNVHTITTAELRELLGDTLTAVSDDRKRVIITRHGKALAVLMPLDDLILVERVEAKIDAVLGLAAYEEIRAGRVMTLDEVRAHYLTAPAAVRDEAGLPCAEEVQ